ncbi:MAG TPA: PEP-CTERM sorting domain-containing protein [Longimicrobiales bacterium]|nr:PEP-CTERM sorting domain-containing protein [Longimicrobiales bacterium]
MSVRAVCLVALAVVLVVTAPASAGSFFLTGHDPDFHAFLGGNTAGASNINNAAIDFVTDPAFNPLVAGGATKFLFVESKGSVPSGHTLGVNGIIASGFTLGTDFDHHDFITLNAALDALGTTYGAIVVASDFGGILRQDELDILNARSGDIIDFLNAGGGLYAMAESNGGAGLTPDGGHFGFLPFVVSSTGFDQTEVGITVTPFGVDLGLSNSDVNGNASHNIFAGTFGLSVVDIDQFGNVLTLAGRGEITDGGVGVVPEPATAALVAIGLAGLVAHGFRRRRIR